MTVYTDINFNFLPDQTGDITLVTDEDSIKQSLRNIILTVIGERTIYQRPRFGSKVMNLIGEKFTKVTDIKIKKQIELAIENWEDRVELLSVKTKSEIENGVFKVTIRYNIKNTNEDSELTVTISKMT